MDPLIRAILHDRHERLRAEYEGAVKDIEKWERLLHDATERRDLIAQERDVLAEALREAGTAVR